MRDQVHHTLNKFNEIRQEKLNQVSVKLLKRQDARRPYKPFSTAVHPNPQGCLLLKRGAYDKAMDALEPIYQREKLAKQAEQVLQKSQGCKADPRHTPSSTR
jgi:hypothetical protein